MSSKFDTLKTLFESIRDERNQQANTATRIGSAFLSLLYEFGSFLSRDTDDSASGVITFLKGLLLGDGSHGIDKDGSAILDIVKSSDFLKDFTGFLLQSVAGKSYLEVDQLKVRMKAVFETLEIVHEQSVAGKWIISPAGSIETNKVEEVDGAYRCYFVNDDGEKRIENRFKVGDLAQSKDFNIKAGVYTNVSNKYYWRKVVAVGDNYIDLSKTDCDTGSDIPTAGNTICQLGNDTDTTRQNAMIFSSVDDNSPRVTLYYGINTYSLKDKEYVDYGVDKTTGRAFFNVYGDSYTGARDKSAYIKYTQTNGVEIKGKLAEGTQLPDGSDINSLSTNILNLATGVTNLNDTVKTLNSDVDGLTGDVNGLSNDVSGISGDVDGLKKNVNNLSTGKFNLIRNSGFNGDYQSLDLNSDTTLDTSTELYSQKLVNWDKSNAVVSSDSDSKSGYSCAVTGGYVSQSLYYQQISGENYILSFKAKGTSITTEVGGKAFTDALTSSYVTYTHKYTSGGGSILRLAGTFTICEIQLIIGNVSIDWTQSPLDNDKSLEKFQTIRYITDAMAEGSTQFIGGLALLTQIMLGNYKDGKMQSVTSGLSGIYNNDNDVAFWAGGTFEQAIRAVQLYKNDPNYQPTVAELAAIANAVITHGGRIIMNDAVIRGYIYALGGVFKDVILSGSLRNSFVNSTGNFDLKTHDNTIVIGNGNDDVTGNYTLPWTNDNSGRKITIINYRWDKNTSTGSVVIKAPADKCFFRNNRQENSLVIKVLGMVELLGVGDDTTFYGYIVLHDKYLDALTGNPMDVLAYGSVTVSLDSSGNKRADISAKTFDGSTLTVSRLDTGKYRVTIPGTYNYGFIMLTGCKDSLSDTTIVNACLADTQSGYFDVHTHDDSTLNDGNFNFVIYRNNQFL
jgi:hypothetical protein